MELPFRHKKLKISHHHHSGHYRPHEYTSYIPLMALLLVVGLCMTVATVFAASPGPMAGSVGLTGTVPAKPPTTAAVITSPTSGQRFTTTPVTIKGTCVANTLVELFKNDIFAGSVSCDKDGKFSVDIDLLIGENKLIARIYDDLNQPGPDSVTVTVFYDAAIPQGADLGSLSFGGPQMLLNTDAVFRGVFPEKEMAMPLSIIGGVPPFAINVQWGDSNNKIIPRGDNVTFNATHTYRKAGVYQVTIQATDSQDRVAFLTVASIVNGQPDAVGGAGSGASGSGSGGTTSKLLALWPLYTASLGVVISFWLGEVREKRLMLKQYTIGPVYKP